MERIPGYKLRVKRSIIRPPDAPDIYYLYKYICYQAIQITIYTLFSRHIAEIDRLLDMPNDTDVT